MAAICMQLSPAHRHPRPGAPTSEAGGSPASEARGSAPAARGRARTPCRQRASMAPPAISLHPPPSRTCQSGIQTCPLPNVIKAKTCSRNHDAGASSVQIFNAWQVSDTAMPTECRKVQAIFQCMRWHGRAGHAHRQGPPVGARQRHSTVAQGDVEAAWKLRVPDERHLHRPPQCRVHRQRPPPQLCHGRMSRSRFLHECRS